MYVFACLLTHMNIVFDAGMVYIFFLNINQG